MASPDNDAYRRLKLLDILNTLDLVLALALVASRLVRIMIRKWPPGV